MSVSSFVENDFYAFSDDEGNRDDGHESRMAMGIEGPFNQLLPMLESDLYVTNLSDGVVIAKYVANLFHRTHQRRTASLKQQSETAAVAAEFLKDETKVRQLAAVYSFVFRVPVRIDTTRKGLEALCEKDSGEQDRFFLENLERHEESLFEMLQHRPYGILSAPLGSEFAITDTAIVTRLPIGNYVSIGEGFSKSGVHVILPISPRKCVQIGIPNLDLHRLRPDEVQSINVDQVRLMHRWAYSKTLDPRLESAVNGFGGTVQYKVNAFVTPPLTTDRMLDMLTAQLLNDLASGEIYRAIRDISGRTA